MTRKSANLRFEAVWRRHSDADRHGAEIGMALLEFYNQPERCYHTMEHIDFCLELFDKVSDQCINPDAVELAIWFHDAVYNFPVTDNEQLSAEYFLEVTSGYLPEPMCENVYQQVLATSHKVQPADKDQQILVDIDLSSFGRPWEQFLRDGKNVRRELVYLDDDEFYPGQISFMKELIDRENFYNTPWFQQQFEGTARHNLSLYIESLVRQGYEIG